MAEERAKRTGRRPPTADPNPDEHSHGAFQGVCDKGRSGEVAAASAQHVGGADVAGSDAADIADAGQPREEHAERDRSEQVTEGERAAGVRKGGEVRHFQVPRTAIAIARGPYW